MEMENKITALARELTLDEKIGLIHGSALFHTAAAREKGLPPLVMSDGPMGVRTDFFDDKWMPVNTPADAVSYCPSNTAVAYTWNRKLAKSAGRVLGSEARGRGKDVILGPGINIKRTPLCGRNFEYFSEDPYLIEELCVPMIEGVQESDVAACVKHYALNSQETERLWVNVEMDERALREIYLPGFEAAVKKAGVYSVMGAYNLFRGKHACENKVLLNRILREEWGFDGTVISDWGAVHHTKEAAESSLDIEMSVTYDFDDYVMANPLKKEVAEGRIDEKFIDEKVKNIIRMMVRTNMITLEEKDGHIRGIKNRNRKRGAYDTAAHRQATLDVARESIVLLKNEDNILPLDENDMDKVLVIGANAVTAHAPGGGSAEIKALYEVTPLLGIAKFLGGNSKVDYVPGYYVPENKDEDVNWQENSLNDGASAAGTKDEAEADMSRKLRDEAVEKAKQYDHVIFVGGLNHDYDVEGLDRANLELPYEQKELINALLEVKPDMVITMVAGSPVAMDDWAGKAKAILLTGYCGMEGGTALAEVLFGHVNPSGKLAESFPCKEGGYLGDANTPKEQFPGRPLTKEENAIMDAHLTQEYSEGVFVGYRYYEKNKKPVLFPFGYGLSYTTFEYSDISVKKICETAEVTLTVKNTGLMEGKETVQVYVGAREVADEDPVKELKGFEKISLDAGESKMIAIKLDDKAFMHYDEGIRDWKCYSDSFKVYVAASSDDIRAVVEV